MARQEQLDIRNAAGKPPEQALFFYQGDSEVVAPGVFFFPKMGTSTVFECNDRLLVVDTSPRWVASRTIEELREKHSKAPVETIIYTHGHIDHTSGAVNWRAEAKERDLVRPRIVAHQDVPNRFDRYKLLAEQNNFINRVQFDLEDNVGMWQDSNWVYPDTTYRDALHLEVGGERFELYHARGEADDETWVWCASRRVLCTGDTFVWSSPNAGNPYKVQRYAKDWADALERMAGLRPEVLLPGHGPVMRGEELIQDALLSTAQWLRTIHDQVVEKMNEGKWLEDIIREMEYPEELAKKPWLQPIYDHPEFIARNVYRLYGGWYDGDPANILPAHSDDVARELMGAVDSQNILDRARKLREEGDLQMACHLADWVKKGEPENREAWELFRDLFAERANDERSLMARGAFRRAVRLAEAHLKELG